MTFLLKIKIQLYYSLNIIIHFIINNNSIGRLYKNRFNDVLN